MFREKGIEVLLPSDRVDEWLVASLPSFGGKPLRSASRGELGFRRQADDDAGTGRARAGVRRDARPGVVARCSATTRAGRARCPERLKDSPSCIVVPKVRGRTHGSRWLRELGPGRAASKPILELNPTHPIDHQGTA